jgi:hypothetical protein
VEEVKRAVGGCDVLLALMGADWTTMTNPEGGRRLDDPHDFVRIEIEGALERGVRLIPVLVEGARMPAASELPDSMTPLATREALEITDDRWKYDVGRLMGVLHQMQGTSPAAESDVRPEKARSRRRRDVILGASLAVVAILVLLAIVVGTQEDEFPSEDDRNRDVHGAGGGAGSLSLLPGRGRGAVDEVDGDRSEHRRRGAGGRARQGGPQDRDVGALAESRARLSGHIPSQLEARTQIQ